MKKSKQLRLIASVRADFNRRIRLRFLALGFGQRSNEPGFSFTLECITIPFISSSLFLSASEEEQSRADRARRSFFRADFSDAIPHWYSCPPLPGRPQPPTPIDRPLSTYFIQENIEISNSVDHRDEEGGKGGKGTKEKYLRNARSGARPVRGATQRQHLSRDEVNLLIYQASHRGRPASLAEVPLVVRCARAFPDRKPIHPPSRLTTWLCLMVFAPTDGEAKEKKETENKKMRQEQHEITSH